MARLRPHSLRRWLLGIGGAAALLLLAFSWWVAGQVLRPPFYEHRTPEEGLRPGKLTDPGVDFGLAFEDVTFPAVDASTLRGWVVPPDPAAPEGRSWVVGVHGGGGDRRSFLGVTPRLARAGHPVLLFDCREQGVSDGSGRGMGLGVREWHDVVSAVDFVLERGAPGVAVFGNSQGGVSAVLAASQDPRIDGVVVQSAGIELAGVLAQVPPLASWPEPLVRLIARTVLLRVGAPLDSVATLASGPLALVDRIAPRPLLIIHGDQDEMVPLSQAEALFEAAAEPKELWVVPGAGHRTLRQTAGDAYPARLLAFLDRVESLTR